MKGIPSYMTMDINIINNISYHEVSSTYLADFNSNPDR